MSMRLADFIEKNAEEIMAAWEAFAATRLPAAASMDAPALRNNASNILRAIVADLRAPTVGATRSVLGGERAVDSPGASRTAAEAHGAARAKSGFDVNQVVSEYGALRASVLRLWGHAADEENSASAFEDLIRFDAAVDQAVRESVAVFTQEVERSRNIFLGVLSHELRSPLNAIQATAHHLGTLPHNDVVSRAARRLIEGGSRMRALLDDLLDYSRTTLAYGIRVNPAPTNLARICADVIDELHAADAGGDVELRATGDAQGVWDARRLHQLVSNLVINALNYRMPSTPVRIEVSGRESEVLLSVANRGRLIPRAELAGLFEPLRRLRVDEDTPQHTHLGLGLFVAREIARAHGGEIEVQSDVQQTVFTVRLPRRSD